ncbi:MAG TPA: hypothetical protein VIM71_13715 [Lacunisphaera sp.]
MKSVLYVLLAASLVANVVLGVMARRSASAVSTATPASAATSTGATGVREASTQAAVAGQPKASGGDNAPSAVLTGAVWHAPKSEQDLHRIVADLRAAGYPPDLIRAVVNELLKEHFASRDPNAGQPFWKRNVQTPESFAAQSALGNERRALFEALLGSDARPSSMMDADSRERRYGTLSDDKIDALAKIERDYGEMSAEAWAKRRGNMTTNMEATMQAQQLMEKEKMADMAAVLTPEELAQYEMRNSPSAHTLINNLRNVDITEAEYARLYQAQKTLDEANPQRATMDQNAYLQRQTAQMAFNEEVRTLLGESRFYSYLEGADHNYANVAKALTAYPTVTSAVSYQVYRLQNELQLTMAQASRGGAPSPEKMAEIRTTMESYNTRLETLIGVEAAAAYRKQGMGRMFDSYRNAPRPAGG